MSQENASASIEPTRARTRVVPAKTAAAELGLPYTTLRDLAFRGRIPVIRIGRAWYFDRRDLERFIDRSRESLA